MARRRALRWNAINPNEWVAEVDERRLVRITQRAFKSLPPEYVVTLGLNELGVARDLRAAKRIANAWPSIERALAARLPKRRAA